MRTWYLLPIALCLLMTGYASNYQAKNYEGLKQKMPQIDSKLFDQHFILYRGYVNKVNELDKTRRDLEKKKEAWSSKDTFVYQAVQKQFAFEKDGMVLHELYFDNLGGDGALQPECPLCEAIVSQYGSVGKWKEDFKKISQMRGIGWAILYYDPATQRLRNGWVADHSLGVLVGEKPILVVDLWEHAYITQFGLDRIGYVDIILSYVDWQICENRFAYAVCTDKQKSQQQEAKVRVEGFQRNKIQKQEGGKKEQLGK